MGENYREAHGHFCHSSRKDQCQLLNGFFELIRINSHDIEVRLARSIFLHFTTNKINVTVWVELDFTYEILIKPHKFTHGT